MPPACHHSMPSLGRDFSDNSRQHAPRPSSEDQEHTPGSSSSSDSEFVNETLRPWRDGESLASEHRFHRFSKTVNETFEEQPQRAMMSQMVSTLQLSPWEKWTAQRKFPLKFVLSFINLVLITTQTIIFVKCFQPLDFAMQGDLGVLFFNDTRAPSYRTVATPEINGWCVCVCVRACVMLA